MCVLRSHLDSSFPHDPAVTARAPHAHVLSLRRGYTFLHSAMDGAGLFGGDDSSNLAASVSAKRVMLKRWDHASVQGLDPAGVSVIEGLSLENLWKVVEAGNKAVAFYSNLASKEDTRVGIGLSQAAQALEAAIAKLNQPMMKKLIDPGAMAKAQAEATKLLPALKALNQGKEGTSTKDGVPTWSSMKRKSEAASGPHETPGGGHIEIDAAAKIYFDWLHQPTSPLRSILSLLSGGGVYYAAAVHEKVSRAWAIPNNKTVDDVQRAAKARKTAASGSAPVGVAPDDTKGLF